MDNYINYISIDAEIRFGQPCIVGTRIAIQDILSLLASGMSAEEIIADFPQLNLLHIKAALNFAANSESRIRLISA